MNEKIRWLRNKIKSLDLDAMIVSNPINIKYLTGIEAEGTLILARKENFFITLFDVLCCCFLIFFRLFLYI